MIDFMKKKYIKNVFVDKPQRDNFHFENLISDDENESGYNLFNKYQTILTNSEIINKKKFITKKFE